MFWISILFRFRTVFRGKLVRTKYFNRYQNWKVKATQMQMFILGLFILKSFFDWLFYKASRKKVFCWIIYVAYISHLLRSIWQGSDDRKLWCVCWSSDREHTWKWLKKQTVVRRVFLKFFCRIYIAFHGCTYGTGCSWHRGGRWWLFPRLLLGI